MDLHKRRALLDIKDNPNKAADYIVSLEYKAKERPLVLTIRYVPDRDILDSSCFSKYLDQLLSQHDKSVEELVAYLIDDLNNELVARWVHVELQENREDGTQHNVIIEDQQPQWDNSSLLTRLSKI